VNLSTESLVQPSSSISPSTILRASTRFSQLLSAAYHPSSSFSPSCVLFTFVLFKYLHSGIDLACQLVEDNLIQFEGSDQEEVWCWYVRLLWIDKERHKAWNVQRWRGILDRAIESCPKNSIFLMIYLANEGEFKSSILRYVH
jgi:hypothetical protein